MHPSIFINRPQTSQTLCKCLDVNAHIPGEGFLLGSCHVLITVFPLQNISSDCSLYTCLLRSVCPHKLLWLTEKHLCLCVLPWRQGHPNSSPEERRWGCNVRTAPKSLTISTFPRPGVFEQKISASVGGRGQAVHKQRRGGIYSSACCV